jgi:hypothetical protein
MPPYSLCQKHRMFIMNLPRLAAYPEESCIVAPVPRCRVEHVGRQNTVDDANNVTIHWLATTTNDSISEKASSEGMSRLHKWLQLTIDCGQERLS